MYCFQILLGSKMFNSYLFQSFLNKPEKKPQKNKQKYRLLKTVYFSKY